MATSARPVIPAQSEGSRRSPAPSRSGSGPRADLSARSGSDSSKPGAERSADPAPRVLTAGPARHDCSDDPLHACLLGEDDSLDPPLTSEPPLPDAEQPLTSEPSLTDTAEIMPLTSEPFGLAGASAAGQDFAGL